MDSSQPGRSATYKSPEAETVDVHHFYYPLEGPDLTDDFIDAIEDPRVLRKILINLNRQLKFMKEKYEGLKTKMITTLQHHESDIAIVNEKFCNSIQKVMDEDLSCTICTEICIEPTVLHCSHTFCMYCIFKWMMTGFNGGDCPICRKDTSGPVKAHDMLTNCINKLYNILPLKLRVQRNQVVQKRDKQLVQLINEIEDNNIEDPGTDSEDSGSDSEDAGSDTENWGPDIDDMYYGENLPNLANVESGGWREYLREQSEQYDNPEDIDWKSWCHVQEDSAITSNAHLQQLRLMDQASVPTLPTSIDEVPIPPELGNDTERISGNVVQQGHARLSRSLPAAARTISSSSRAAGVSWNIFGPDGGNRSFAVEISSAEHSIPTCEGTFDDLAERSGGKKEYR